MLVLLGADILVLLLEMERLAVADVADFGSLPWLARPGDDIRDLAELLLEIGLEPVRHEVAADDVTPCSCGLSLSAFSRSFSAPSTALTLLAASRTTV